MNPAQHRLMDAFEVAHGLRDYANDCIKRQERPSAVHVYNQLTELLSLIEDLDGMPVKVTQPEPEERPPYIKAPGRRPGRAKREASPAVSSA